MTGFEDDRIEKSDFTVKIYTDLRSRLHARFIQYELFTFAGKVASVVLHLTNRNITVKLPYVIAATSDSERFILYFRSNEIEGSLQSLISYMLSTMRREEAKLTKFKKAK